MKPVKRYTEPPFWDNFIHEEPLCKALVENWQVIREESIRLNKIEKILRSLVYTTYPVKVAYASPVSYTVNWKLAPFFGGRHDVNIRRRTSWLQLIRTDIMAFLVRKICPKTYFLMSVYFDSKLLLNASFAKLSPGSIIRPHIHPSNKVKRMNVHLGLICDPDCKITVGEESRTWEEGKLLAFKSTGPYRHGVVHGGKKERVILFLEFDALYLEQYGVYKGERIYD